VALLCAQPWPGNVRQLENAVFRAVVLAERDEIGTAEFPQIAAQPASEAPQPPAAPLLLDADAPMAAISLDQSQRTQSPQLSPELAQGSLPIVDAHGDIRPLAEIEAELIQLAIAHYDGQMSEVARRLRIGRSTLYRRLKDLGLDPGDGREISSNAVAEG
jgi:DNA-binding NtrC family response regulator